MIWRGKKKEKKKRKRAVRQMFKIPNTLSSGRTQIHHNRSVLDSENSAHSPELEA